MKTTLSMAMTRWQELDHCMELYHTSKNIYIYVQMDQINQTMSSMMKATSEIDSPENILILEIAAMIGQLNDPNLSSKKRTKQEQAIDESKKQLMVLLGKSFFWRNSATFLDEVNRSFPFDGPKQYCQLIQFRPHIYGVCAKSIKYSNKKKFTDKTIEWSCVKVGFTQTDGDPTSRANTVKNLIVSSFSKGGLTIQRDDIVIIFCVPIAFSNFHLFREVEDSVRSAVGIPIPAAAAKELFLPVPTEWVYAHKLHIEMCTIPLDSEHDTSFLSKKGAFKGKTPDNLALDLVNECASTGDSDETELLTKLTEETNALEKLEKNTAKSNKKKALKMSGEKSNS